MTASLNSILAAGLFDSPWVVAVILIVSALANWLSKRRADKTENPPSEDNGPTPPATKPAGEFNLEETLRRMMGEETKPPTTPPVIHPAPGRVSPAPSQREFERARAMKRPPPIAAVMAGTPTTVTSQQRKAARRFEELNERGRHPATVVGLHGYRSTAAKRAAAQWHNPRSARQAFVASLVFAPPKGLES